MTSFLSCHKAEEDYKPEEVDLFLRMDALKDSDGTWRTPMELCGLVTTAEIFLIWCLFHSAFSRC